jgi:hypothetical protein
LEALETSAASDNNSISTTIAPTSSTALWDFFGRALLRKQRPLSLGFFDERAHEMSPHIGPSSLPRRIAFGAGKGRRRLIDARLDHALHCAEEAHIKPQPCLPPPDHASRSSAHCPATAAAAPWPHSTAHASRAPEMPSWSYRYCEMFSPPTSLRATRRLSRQARRAKANQSGGRPP